MFKKILVPLDRSPLAEQAIGQAAAIARGAGAEIDIVIVHQPIPFAGFRDAPWSEDEQNWARKYLESIAEEITGGSSVSVTHAVLTGEASECICQRAVDIDADLIVMTSHGRTGLSRTWLGSTADRVVRNSSVPVLMLRPVEDKSDRIAAHKLFKHILVPVDNVTPSDEILAAAAALAKCGGGDLTLLHVLVPVPMILPRTALPIAYSPMVPDPTATLGLAEEVKQQLTEAARLVSRDEGVPAESQVVIDEHVAQAILDAASGRGADAIAMTTHGRGASRFLLGSIADKVIRATHIPILLVHPDAAELAGDLEDVEEMAVKTS